MRLTSEADDDKQDSKDALEAESDDRSSVVSAVMYLDSSWRSLQCIVASCAIFLPSYVSF